MFRSKSRYEIAHVIRLRPHATHDDVSRGSVERHAPRTKVLVVQLVFRNCVYLRVLCGELAIKRIDARMRRNAGYVAVAQLQMQLTGPDGVQPRAGMPDGVVATHVSVVRVSQ